MAHEFPNLFYIRSRSQVFGLFGPGFMTGPQPWAPMSQHAWIETHVRTRHGLLGALYPQRLWAAPPWNDHGDATGDDSDLHIMHAFMEGGGTGTWIGLVNKGLFVPEEISWGGWDGAIHYARDFAPLWRWREAYTNDFKARMDWCVAEYEQANHNPRAVLMGDDHRTVCRLTAEPGERIELDASGSYDPDGDLLIYKWGLYPEAGTYEGDVVLEQVTQPVATVTVPADAQGKQLHVILEVTDQNDIAPLTAYRRIVIDG